MVERWNQEDSRRVETAVMSDEFWRSCGPKETVSFMQAAVIFSLWTYPTVAKLSGVFLKASPFSSADIIGAIRPEATNPFFEFADRWLVPLATRGDFAFIGLSLTHESEVIPAMTFARRIKASGSDAKVVIGGIQATLMAPGLSVARDVVKDVDYIVCSPVGEDAFARLMACSTEEEIEKVPCVYYHKDGRMVCSDARCKVDLCKVGCPMYPSKYMGCYSDYGLSTNLFCHWRQCAFCTYTHSPRIRASMDVLRADRSMDLVVEDIAGALRSCAAPSKAFFHIEDSSLVLSRLTALLVAARAAGQEIEVSAFMRFDRELLDCGSGVLDRLRALGLRRVFMGLESGCQRINDLMRKGVNVADAGEIARRLHSAEIQVTIGTIIGYPTESPAEASRTLDFIWSVLPSIRGAEINPFRMEKTSAIYSMAPSLGIQLWGDAGEDLTLFSRYGMAGSISSDESVGICNDFNRALLPRISPELDWSTLFKYGQ
jgi:hypothetical protein